MSIKPRPSWTNDYPAIDGIATREQVSRDYDGDIHVKPSKPAVREDVRKLLELDEPTFRDWLEARRSAVERMKQEWELLASIPCLTYGTAEYGMGAITIISNMISDFRRAGEYLDKLVEARKDIARLTGAQDQGFQHDH